jgi:hypothetical protein
LKVIQFWSLLERFGLLHHVFAFVKNDDTNLMIMVTILHSINDCEPLKFFKVYEGTCFGHVMLKAYQYTTNDNKFFVRLRNMTMKEV